MLRRGGSAARCLARRGRRCAALGLALALQAGGAAAQRVKEVPVDLDAEEPEKPAEKAPAEAPAEKPPVLEEDEGQAGGSKDAAKPTGDEVIEDPELAGKTGAAAAPGAGGDSVIENPELSGTKTGAPPSSGSEPGTNEVPSAGPTTWRVVLATRWGADMQWLWPSQEVIDGTTIGLIEVSQRRSESLSYSVGLRARHNVGRQQDGDTRTSLDAVPVSGYADFGFAEGMHLRAGYQVIKLGTFDVFSASNVLAVADLRGGPASMPDAIDVAQIALGYDLALGSSVSVEAYYVPFFTPHIIDLYGTDYAIGTRIIDRPLDTATPAGNPLGDQARQFRDEFENRSASSYAARSVYQALAPEPDLSSPQAALRLTLHGADGELGLTLATALEHFPAVKFRDDVVAYYFEGLGRFPNPNAPPPPPPPGLFDGRWLWLDFARYEVAALDGTTAFGPVQVGFEAAYMANRTLGATAVGRPFTLAEQVPVAQLGVRAEYAESAAFVIAGEAFVSRPLREPSVPGLEWSLYESNGFLRGVSLGVQWTPDEEGLKFELGGIVMSGISVAVVPRLEWEIAEGLSIELGAMVVDGAPPAALGAPQISLGGAYDDVDQVFTGIRWLP